MNNSKYMKILDRIMVGQDRYLLIVRVGSKTVLIGVAPSGIKEIMELSEEELLPLDNSSNEQMPGSFQEILAKMRNKKKE